MCLKSYKIEDYLGIGSVLHKSMALFWPENSALVCR